MIDRYKKYTVELDKFIKWSSEIQANKIKRRFPEFVMSIKDSISANENLDFYRKSLTKETVIMKGSAIGSTTHRVNSIGYIDYKNDAKTYLQVSIN